MTRPIRSLLIANRGEIAVRIIPDRSRHGAADHRGLFGGGCRRAACADGGRKPIRWAQRLRADSYLRHRHADRDRRARAGRMPSIPATASCRRMRRLPMPAPRRASCLWGHPLPPSAPWAPRARAKALMDKAGVPLVPGYHGEDQDPDLLAREAERIGYPVLIKASAGGGGGKGMKVVRAANEFADALASAQREARNAFGRRSRAGGEISHPAPPYRGAGLRRHPWQLRLSARARLLHPAPPPEGGGGGAGPRHDPRAPRPHGPGGGGGCARGGICGRGERWSSSPRATASSSWR